MRQVFDLQSKFHASGSQFDTQNIPGANNSFGNCEFSKSIRDMVKYYYKHRRGRAAHDRDTNGSIERSLFNSSTG